MADENFLDLRQSNRNVSTNMWNGYVDAGRRDAMNRLRIKLLCVQHREHRIYIMVVGGNRKLKNM